MKPRILVADDDPGIRDTLEAVLAEDGYDVRVAASSGETVAAIRGQPFDVMLLDLKMPDCTGLELLERVRSVAPDVAVIMMTAYGTVRVAVEAVKQGAYDFVTKPFELEEMRVTIKKALEMRRLTQENGRLRQMLEEKLVCKDIIGTGRAMQDVFEVVRKVVNYDVAVLLTGESGTGKELVARAIHTNSPRRDKPFVKLNCAALPETLLESELFGYEKGAFTGAAGRKPGRFELAEGGTIFLDEIGDTSLNMQSKLLRVLQEKEFERVGGRETIRVDVRVVAATNKDLRTEVQEKRFREDLFYRLNVVNIHLPPLRDRTEDIPALVHHFLKELNLLFQKDFSSVSPEAMTCLLRYGWPGNVRELRNVLEKAVLLGEGTTLVAHHLPGEICQSAAEAGARARERVPAEARAPAGEPARAGKPDDAAAARVSLDEVEKEHIYRVMRDARWNQTRAAEVLGIHRNTLRKKLERFNLGEAGP